VGGLFSILSNPISTLIDRLVPDKAANDAAKATLAQMALSGELQTVAGQLQVNLAEASSRSTFVSGWRPFVGWVCGCGLAYAFLVMPLGNGFAALRGHPGIFPALDTSTLLTCLGGMLGLGGLRTAEKFGQVAAK
jgi:Holin of 3TMs, for gene-transfer release